MPTWSCIEVIVRSCSVRKVFLKIWQKFTGNHLCQSLFLIKLQADACNFIKNKTLAQVFSCEFCQIFKNTYFVEHLRTTASACNYFNFQFNHFHVTNFFLYLLKTSRNLLCFLCFQALNRSSHRRCSVKKRCFSNQLFFSFFFFFYISIYTLNQKTKNLQSPDIYIYMLWYTWEQKNIHIKLKKNTT